MSTFGHNPKIYMHCQKEDNKFARRGYIYCWYYKIIDDTGNVLKTDNTGNFHGLLDQALWQQKVIVDAYNAGILDIVKLKK